MRVTLFHSFLFVTTGATLTAHLIGAGNNGRIPGVMSIEGWSRTSTEEQQAWTAGLVVANVALVVVYGLIAVQLVHKPRYVNAAGPHLQNIGSYADPGDGPCELRGKCRFMQRESLRPAAAV